MASELLHNLFTKNIKMIDFVKWLANEHEELDEAEHVKIKNFGCGRGEFAVFFINHLRDATENIPDTVGKEENTPLKDILEQSNSVNFEHEYPKLEKIQIRSPKHGNTFNSEQLLESSNISYPKTPPAKNKAILNCSSEIILNQSVEKNRSPQFQLHENNYDKCFNGNASLHNSTPLKQTAVNKSFVSDWPNHSLISSPPTSKECLQSFATTVGTRFDNISSKSSRKVFNTFSCDWPNLSFTTPNKQCSKSFEITVTKKFDDISSKSDRKKSRVNKTSNSKDGSKKSNEFSPRSSRNSAGRQHCVGDFISAQKVKRKDQANVDSLDEKNTTKSSRRIKPTCLEKAPSQNSTRKNDSSMFSPNIRNVEPNPVFKIYGTKEDVHATSDRDSLRAECLKIKQQQESAVPRVNTFTLTPTKNSKNINEINMVVPRMESVTHRNILNIYIELYCTLLAENLVTNIINEIYFTISLLLIKQIQIKTEGKLDLVELNDEIKETKSNKALYSSDLDSPEKVSGEDVKLVPLTDSFDEDTTSSEEDYFNTVHNCVYFAINVLLNQKPVLNYFDRLTIKLLRDDFRVQFSVPLSEFLQELHTTKVKKETETSKWEKLDSNFNVCFISDTDNLSNFPSALAFSAFRKQRDLFYDILRQWESNHFNAKWNFTVCLGAKIKLLLNQSSDPINYMHLARLFKSQLLRNCGFRDHCVESDTKICSSLKNISAAKLSLLQSRLTDGPSGTNDVCLGMSWRYNRKSKPMKFEIY